MGNGLTDQHRQVAFRAELAPIVFLVNDVPPQAARAILLIKIDGAGRTMELDLGQALAPKRGIEPAVEESGGLHVL